MRTHVSRPINCRLRYWAKTQPAQHYIPRIHHKWHSDSQDRRSRRTASFRRHFQQEIESNLITLPVSLAQSAAGEWGTLVDESETRRWHSRDASLWLLPVVPWSQQIERKKLRPYKNDHLTRGDGLIEAITSPITPWSAHSELDPGSVERGVESGVLRHGRAESVTATRVSRGYLGPVRRRKVRERATNKASEEAL